MYSNLFSSINNGYKSKKNFIFINKSKKNLKIIEILFKEGFIKNFYINDIYNIKIYLKYNNNKPIINKITQISKPSKKIYIKNNFFIKKKRKGIFLISTSKGILTSFDIKKFFIGGELICYIY